MTITTKQAIALAREVGATVACQFGEHYEFDISSEELTAFANAVRKQTLLEAAEFVDTQGLAGRDRMMCVYQLRWMAGVE